MLYKSLVALMISCLWTSLAPVQVRQDHPMVDQEEFVRHVQSSILRREVLKAVQQCDARLAEDDRDAWAYALRAVAKSWQGQIADSLDDSRKAGEIAPQNAEILAIRSRFCPLISF